MGRAVVLLLAAQLVACEWPEFVCIEDRQCTNLDGVAGSCLSQANGSACTGSAGGCHCVFKGGGGGDGGMGCQWQRESIPMQRAPAFNSVWIDVDGSAFVVAEDGSILRKKKGQGWQLAATVSGPLLAIAGTGTEFFIAGDPGVYHNVTLEAPTIVGRAVCATDSAVYAAGRASMVAASVRPSGMSSWSARMLDPKITLWTLSCSKNLIVVAGDQGHIWTSAPTVPPGFMPETITGVDPSLVTLFGSTSDKDGNPFVVGSQGAIFGRLGTSWSNVVTPGVLGRSNFDLQAVWGTGLCKGCDLYVVGAKASLNEDRGLILHFRNDRWDEESVCGSDVPPPLGGVFGDADSVYAVGVDAQGGFVLRRSRTQ